MTNAMQTTTNDSADIIERAIIGGDLSRLTPAERTSYYMKVCESLGLNPLTRPFGYITLKGKLTLYALKDCAEQLRRINRISIGKPDIQYQDDYVIVTVSAHDDHGREDSDVAVVNKKDMQGDFGNVVMKCVTKAKRRVTLSICGLGMLDETEVETIPEAVIAKNEALSAPQQAADTPTNGKSTGAPSLEEAFAAWQATWMLAQKAGKAKREYFATTAENISTIVDKTNALRDLLKDKISASGGK